MIQLLDNLTIGALIAQLFISNNRGEQPQRTLNGIFATSISFLIATSNLQNRIKRTYIPIPLLFHNSLALSAGSLLLSQVDGFITDPLSWVVTTGNILKEMAKIAAFVFTLILFKHKQYTSGATALAFILLSNLEETKYSAYKTQSKINLTTFLLYTYLLHRYSHPLVQLLVFRQSALFILQYFEYTSDQIIKNAKARISFLKGGNYDTLLHHILS